MPFVQADIFQYPYGQMPPLNHPEHLQYHCCPAYFIIQDLRPYRLVDFQDFEQWSRIDPCNEFPSRENSAL